MDDLDLLARLRDDVPELDPAVATRTRALLVAAAAAAPPVPAAVAVALDELRPLAGAYVHPTTGAMVFLSLRGDTLIAGRTAGPALVPIGPRRFRVSGQPVEFEFSGNGALREHPLTWPARSPVTWRRETPVQPTAAQLAAYAGTYHSEELGATYTVTVRDSALVFGTRWATDVVLRPTYADAFAGPFVVNFTRRGGKVDGMAMSSGRVRRVRFTRTR